MNLIKKYKAVIFDLDGTLVDSAPGLARAMNEVLTKHNFPTHPIEKYHDFIGNGIRALVEQSVPQNTPSQLCDLLYKEKTELYEKYWQEGTLIYPGIIELLEELKNRNIEMGIVSSKEEYFTKLLVDRFFPAVPFIDVVGRSETIPKKPDPKGTLQIVNKSSVALEDWALVGDKTVDMESAKNAKIAGIWVSWGYQTETPPFDFMATINKPRELLAYF